jgi:endonuclease YncB( thermonuclease family)
MLKSNVKMGFASGSRRVLLSSLRLPILAVAVVSVLLIRNFAPWWGPTDASASITVHAEVTDGDSLKTNLHRLRLMGIDAPERAQFCKRNGEIWHCGRAAQIHLARLIGNHPVECSVSGRDKYRRLLARCRVGTRDINRSMVRDGLAVAFGTDYRREEAAARKARRGLWARQFERPRPWRRSHPRH